MKVILNYDPVTGGITDSNGMLILTWLNLNYDFASNIDKLKDLKEAGFTAKEMIELNLQKMI